MWNHPPATGATGAMTYSAGKPAERERHIACRPGAVYLGDSPEELTVPARSVPYITVLFMVLASAGLGLAQSPSDETAKTEASANQEAAPKSSGLDPTMKRVRQMADELRSPFCPGKTLMTCTSYQAFELRREIETMVRAGLSDEEILKRLKTVHGDDISNPKQPWYTFFVPFLPFIVLAGLIFWIVRRWRTRGTESEIGTADLEAREQASEQPVDEERRARLRARVNNLQD